MPGCRQPRQLKSGRVLTDKQQFYAVLHLVGIRSPLDAVRAAIVAERGGAMIKKLSIVSACLAGTLGIAHAESWRMGLEFIDQWSLFTCADTGTHADDRFWNFTVEDSRLSANGPDGVSWTTTVSAEGAFKSNFTGYYQRHHPRHDY